MTGLSQALGRAVFPVVCGIPCGRFNGVVRLTCLLHRCNTRYEWLVRPHSAGTCTLPEAPSFAWRTHAAAQPLPEAGAERTLEAVGCSASFGMESPARWGCL